MNKIFIDSDVILDLLIKREPHYLFAAKLFSLIEQFKINAYTSPLIIANIYYILSKVKNKKWAMEKIRKITTFFEIAPMDNQIVSLALDSQFKDFEDSLQYYTAKKQGIPILITRNKKDYPVKDITICSAEEYLKMSRTISDN